MVILGIFLILLTGWGTFVVSATEQKILIFGIVGALITTIISVYSITLTHDKVKERELELLRIKEKQKVFQHFYNAYFDIIVSIKKGKGGKVTPKLISDMMEFKKGLMNWGSEELIANYLDFDLKAQQPSDPSDPYRIIRDGNKFLKDLRKDLGFDDQGKVNIMSIILDGDARREFESSNNGR
ncbi:MAG: hypothetical protein DHS20C12_06730 [Pseudohongiella sp.]|nr:MAG: hypothetical protein DHS20C12_06730 [Pseudohongiella sp.]